MTGVRCSVVVGRDAEIAAIRARLVSASRCHGGVAAVIGPAGVGKSRLVREALIGSGTTEATGRAAETAGSAPYRPVTEALLALLRVRAIPDDAALRPWLPILGVIVPGLGVTAATGTTPITCGEAVVRLLAALSIQTPITLVLEDVHWADAETLDIVEYLADNLAGHRILCLVTVRDDAPSDGLRVVQRLNARRAVEPVRVEPLSTSEVVEMVRRCVPKADAATVERITSSCDGLPFLVEELLTSPEVPTSFAASVVSRLEHLDARHRRIIGAAAMLGASFDWRLLAPQTGSHAADVEVALELAVQLQLLVVEGDAFRFRHALTADAVRQLLLPPERAALAHAALAVIDAGPVGDDRRGLAVELAIHAGDLDRAGDELAALGSAALARGALASAIEALRRAIELLGSKVGAPVQLAMLRSLALAGRVDEALSLGNQLLTTPAVRGDPRAAIDVHRELARAAVAAERWVIAAQQLSAARAALRGALGMPGITVLDAEVALAGGDLISAIRLAAEVTTAGDATADEVCQAYELIGRSRRQDDLLAAEVAFSAELDTAERAGLSLWQLRALHELGTIDMFENGGIERLALARQMADATGAVGIGATIDVQLAASFLTRYDTAQALEHSRRAQDIAATMGLDGLLAIARWFEAEIHMFGGRWDEMETCAAAAVATDPANRHIAAWLWCGVRAISCLLREDRLGTIENMAIGHAMLDGLPPAAPAPFLAMWPLVATLADDDRAEHARETAADAFHLKVNRSNRGLLAFADAIVAGRAGEGERAVALMKPGMADLAHDRLSGPMALRLVAEAALTDGWGEPIRWLREAESQLTHHGDGAMARACRALRDQRRFPLTSAPFTGREREVLQLVAAGLANKEIAAQLHLSPRTVEKHVEALLRKTALRSRTQLVAAAFEERHSTT